MAKSHNDRWRAQQNEQFRRVLAEQRIWPAWTRNLGAMIEAGIIVRFACDACRRVYDVDVEALAILRGRAWSLIGRTARCKASKCRARGAFVAAAAMDDAFIGLSGPMPPWLIGARPSGHEPDGGGPDGGPGGGGPPPCPKGVDAVRWAYARSDAERKRLVREARG